MKKPLLIHIPKTAGNSIKNTNLFFNHYHTKAKHIKHINKFVTTVAVCRNIFDRLVSAWEYLRNGGMAQFFNDKIDQRTIFCSSNTFEEFLTNKDLFEYAVRYMQHFVPQYEFICDYNGKLLIEHIIRYEHLEADFEHLCKKLNLPNVKLPHLNKTKNRLPWQEYYDEHLRKIVVEAYKYDFELLKYGKEIL